MKKMILFILLCGFVIGTQAQKDTGMQAKTTTQSRATYQYQSSFKAGKTESVKTYLAKELGPHQQGNDQEYSWHAVSMMNAKPAPAHIRLRQGEIEISWKSEGTNNSAGIIKRLEELSAAISKLVE